MGRRAGRTRGAGGAVTWREHPCRGRSGGPGSLARAGAAAGRCPRRPGPRVREGVWPHPRLCAGVPGSPLRDP
ncbi:unnamed protein product [Rangifer tarandus platyrhynchus]|uniref:Uncharacterized protein n=1 Tax=Rangifer tarandus platyrhynchus TaxID=3082113 RepID=A0ABN8Z962_RANTA|nr:unnamed protein product [Rangifer tarandus platyrhynchus]